MTWDKSCTWRVSGWVTFRGEDHLGQLMIKAPDPDTAMEIAQRMHRMHTIEQVKHMSGKAGQVRG